MFVDPLYSRILLHAFGLILAACVPTAGRADDWPMLAHDCARSGATATEIRPPFERKWYRLFPDEGLMAGVQPVIAGGKVFVGTLRGTLHAMDSETGRDVWVYRTNGAILHARLAQHLRSLATSDPRGRTHPCPLCRPDAQTSHGYLCGLSPADLVSGLGRREPVAQRIALCFSDDVRRDLHRESMGPRRAGRRTGRFRRYPMVPRRLVLHSEARPVHRGRRPYALGACRSTLRRILGSCRQSFEGGLTTRETGPS